MLSIRAIHIHKLQSVAGTGTNLFSFILRTVTLLLLSTSHFLNFLPNEQSLRKKLSYEDVEVFYVRLKLNYKVTFLPLAKTPSLNSLSSHKAKLFDFHFFSRLIFRLNSISWNLLFRGVREEVSEKRTRRPWKVPTTWVSRWGVQGCLGDSCRRVFRTNNLLYGFEWINKIDNSIRFELLLLLLLFLYCKTKARAYNFSFIIIFIVTVCLKFIYKYNTFYSD